MYIELARRLRWDKNLVREQDPDYIDELLIALKAETDDLALKRQEQERQLSAIYGRT